MYLLCPLTLVRLRAYANKSMYPVADPIQFHCYASPFDFPHLAGQQISHIEYHGPLIFKSAHDFIEFNGHLFEFFNTAGHLV